MLRSSVSALALMMAGHAADVLARAAPESQPTTSAEATAEGPTQVRIENAAPAQSSSGAELSLPTRVDGNPAREVNAILDGLHITALDAGSLAASLEGRADAAVLQQLRARTGAIGVAELSSLGVIVRLDPDSLILEIALQQEARAAQGFTFQGGPYDDAAVAAPAANFSLGVTTAVRYLRASGRFDQETADLDLTGFANVGGLDGAYLLYGGSLRLIGPGRSFERNRIVAFHDDIDSALRYSVGDLIPLVPRQLGDIQLAGISIERNYQEIQPLRNVRPTGQRSFRVERPSRVEIYSNGALLRTLEVQPGLVDLRSIPAINTTSNISIVVEDSFGRRELDAFTLTSELELLAQGISEFNLSAGVLRDDRFGSYSYSNDPVATGFYRRGLSERLTLGAHFAASERLQSVGGDIATVTLGGLLAASATASFTSAGTGAATTLEYRGDPFGMQERNGQLNLQAEARTRTYREMGVFAFVDPIKFDLAADYRFDVNDRFGVSAGVSYFKLYDEPGASRSLFAGVQASLGRAFVSATGRYAIRSDGQDESGVLFTLSMPLGRKHYVTAVADTGSQRARVEFRRRRDFTIPEFDYSGFAQTSPLGEEFGARIRFANSRAEAESAVTRAFGPRGGTTATVRAQGGIAFVDGVFAIGRDPGRGFAVVSRNPNFKGEKIDVFSQGSNRRVAQVNGFGPAVVPQVAPYRPDSIRVSLLGDNPYLDVGTGEYATQPGASTGHHLSIGSDSVLSGTATFVTSEGVPLKAKFGDLIGATGGASQSIFTTSDGRAFMSELQPGRYFVSFAEGRYHATIEVPQDSEGTIDFGRVTLQEK